MKGSKRDAKDKSGKTPVQMIGESLPDTLKADLKAMLKTPSYWECFMIKAPLTPLKPNHKT